VCLDADRILATSEPITVPPPAGNCFSLAVPAQLQAVGESCTSQFTGAMFRERLQQMGRGFDLTRLTTIDALRDKFDRLATNWEEMATGMHYEFIFHWIAREYQNSPFPDTWTVLDACCAVGLPGQTLRMLGYAGVLWGCDISPKMLEKAAARDCFDDLFVADANHGLAVFDSSIDVILLTGATEILDVPAVIGHCAAALKAGGQLWVSFQWDNGTNPTGHQNVSGMKQDEAVDVLGKSGFSVVDIQQCKDAFVTPKPSETGEVVLVPVPYLFVRALKT
jgi:predicted TPR repeat methyltransferase